MNLCEINIKKHSRNLLLAVIFAMSFFGFSEQASADWQSTLEETFLDAKVVETFDRLNDWGGDTAGHFGTNLTYTGDMPTKSVGGSGPWGVYSSDGKAIEISTLSSFAKNNTVTGSTSGTVGYVASTKTEDGKYYLVLNKLSDTNNFTIGETITNGSGASATVVGYVKWIGDHGTAYNWRGTGKSLTINYNDFTKDFNNETGSGTMTADYPDNIMGFGPTRLGLYFGDGVTGKSGLKKVYLFMMVKFRPGFFPLCSESFHNSMYCKGGATTGYASVGTLKFFDINSGFTAPAYWGNATEHASVTTQTPDNDQVGKEYGCNNTIINIIGGGDTYQYRLLPQENGHLADLTAYGWDYKSASYSGRSLSTATYHENDVDTYYDSSDWFGLEVAMDIGTVGNADGTIDFWVYDKNGTQMGQWSSTDNRLLQFDHYYNKIVLGGNRLCRTYGACPIGQDNRWYADDVIVNGSQIGPTYFTTLDNYSENDTVAPASPQGLSVL